MCIYIYVYIYIHRHNSNTHESSKKYTHTFVCLPASLQPQVREVDSNAAWRAQPLSHADCILRILRNRGVVNPLLTAPWVSHKIFRMDWLHVSDLGVAADFIGNFFH